MDLHIPSRSIYNLTTDHRSCQNINPPLSIRSTVACTFTFPLTKTSLSHMAAQDSVKWQKCLLLCHHAPYARFLSASWSHECQISLTQEGEIVGRLMLWQSGADFLPRTSGTRFLHRSLRNGRQVDSTKSTWIGPVSLSAGARRMVGRVVVSLA